MKKGHLLSIRQLDKLLGNLYTLRERSLLLRGLLSLYVTESEHMVDISINTLANYIWDLTEDSFDIFSDMLCILNCAEAICFEDHAEEVTENVSE